METAQLLLWSLTSEVLCTLLPFIFFLFFYKDEDLLRFSRNEKSGQNFQYAVATISIRINHTHVHFILWISNYGPQRDKYWKMCPFLFAFFFLCFFFF